MPGRYTVTMFAIVDGKTQKLSQPQQFDVVPLRDGALPSKSYSETLSSCEMLKKRTKKSQLFK